MTKQQLIDFNQALISVDKMSASVAFAYAVALNRKTIKNEIEALEESFKIRHEYLQFDRERVALCEKLARISPINQMISASGIRSVKIASKTS